MRGVNVKNSCEMNDRAQPVTTQYIHRPPFKIMGKKRLDCGMISVIAIVEKSIKNNSSRLSQTEQQPYYH